MDLHVFPIPVPTPTSLSTRALWVFPVHQARALASWMKLEPIIQSEVSQKDKDHYSFSFILTVQIQMRDEPSPLKQWAGLGCGSSEGS